eukprot:TRINITY_DN107683_c0_g1_i1.p1 TRINITY_DN107683_c0_g1~~TRINITY_DN107683_c0_g1_i1.p1  ORF type:complete len:539 (-),score=111.66 TRINITY_DN107683_c0_g1_i1:142-1758(-)
MAKSKAEVKASAQSKSKAKPKQCRAEVEEKPKARARSCQAVSSTTSKKRRTVANIHSSVIKVFVSHTQPNYSQPWCTDAQTSSTSSGFPIRLPSGEKRLITNAHSVEHATLVQVKRHHHEQKWVAKVLCIGPDCDLALLEVPSPDFWKGLTPLEICGDLPSLQDAVSVVGYPTGGENLSVTQGVVSRIDLVEYAQSSTVLLAVQIDAAINSGNSGGPVVDDRGNLMGVAFQNLAGEDEENIGYIIPSEVLLHFLDDFRRHGRFTGFGTAGFTYQTLESPMLREALGLTKGQSGVRIKGVEAAGPSAGVLKANDVLLRVDGHPVGNDGTVAFSRGRIPFNYLLQRFFCGDTCELSILRGGWDGEGVKKLKVNVAVEREKCLVDSDAGGPHSTSGCMAARYLVAGGLVFVPLTRPYLESAFGENWSEERPSELSAEMLFLSENGERDTKGHEPIVLTSVLANEITIGYEEMEAEILETFNGMKVENLKHLAELLDTTREKYLKFAFRSKDTIVLESAVAKKALPAILSQNMIPAARSQQL